MRSREVVTFCQKLRSMLRSYKYSGYLITGYTAGGLQRARTIFGLSYGTREPAWQCKGKCTMESIQRQNTEVACRGGLTRSSDEVSVMEMEQRGQLIYCCNLPTFRRMSLYLQRRLEEPCDGRLSSTVL